jgi:hypothetical protein
VGQKFASWRTSLACARAARSLRFECAGGRSQITQLHRFTVATQEVDESVAHLPRRAATASSTSSAVLYR